MKSQADLRCKTKQFWVRGEIKDLSTNACCTVVLKLFLCSITSLAQFTDDTHRLKKSMKEGKRDMMRNFS